MFFLDIENGESENNSEDKSTGDVQDMAKIILKLICDGKKEFEYHFNKIVRKIGMNVRLQLNKLY